MANKDALKVAVIGGGHIAQQHLPVLRDLPEAALVSLVEKQPQTLQETADRFAIPRRFSSHLELLEHDRPDAVFVLVSVLQVAAVAAACIRAGVPTFMEKPPGLYTGQTRELAALVRRHQTPAMVGVNRRFYSTMLQGRQQLLANGPVRSVVVEVHEDISRLRSDPRSAAKFPEEVVRRWSAANSVHGLDMLRFFGGDVTSVETLHRTVEGPVPDCCTAVMEFEGGAVGRALMDWFAPGAYRFQVRSAGATLNCEHGFNTVQLQRRGAADISIERDELDRRYKAGFFRQDQAFLQSVKAGEKAPFPACDLEDALKTMELVDAVAGTSGEDDDR